MCAVSSYKTVNLQTVRLYDLFIFYFSIAKNSAIIATDMDVMLSICSALTPILRS